jgi:hypothetical protein
MGKHFSKFGDVEKMYLNPEKQSAIIHFKEHKSARKAKEKGLMISTKIAPIGAIFYHRKNRTRKSSEMKKDVPGIVTRADTSKEGDGVQDELRNMEEYSSDNIFQTRPFIGTGGKVDFPAGTRKRKGDLASKPGIKKSALNPDILDVPTVSAPIVSAPITRPIVSVSELMSKMQCQAIDDLERYNILEARDKYMKEIRQLKDIQTSLKGACPDICPEKERYSRSSKNQLRLYEKIEGLVHHKAVVKEYSRSAADASIPLSHEMRPAHILTQTMDHLLCNVIDRIDQIGHCGSMEDWYYEVERANGKTEAICQLAITSNPNNESAGDWFEYLWSATRGIRKDITQQDLTDLLAVDLVEKCARFHIMCAERLVEEDSHNFASKLNDENLTKCIQTLTHMYYDLGLENTRCPNEPEFRAYEVLLNMNDGDTLRRVQNLEPWVRQSSEISFALKVLTSLSNNNYVKFFKLVKEATLLQGCILLRYFNQVRRRALDTMIRAYCSSRSVTQYSLFKVKLILGFEDISSCSRYCSIHGMQNEVESDVLYMDRSTFSYPSETPTMQRSINLIECKRQCKWSAVVNGGPLPSINPFISYLPHDSFDKNGFLKKEAYEAKDQTLIITEDWNKSFEELQQKQMKMRLQEQASLEIIDELIVEVSGGIISQVSNGAIKSTQMSKAAMEIIEDFAKEVSGEISQQVAVEAIKEAKNMELQRRIKKEEIMVAAEDVTDEIVEDVVLEMITHLAKDEMKNNTQNLMLKKQMALAPSIWEDISKEVIESEIVTFAENAIKEAVHQRERLIDVIRQRRLKKIQRKSFNAWRHYVAKLQKQKNTLANFPSTPSLKSIAEQADLLSWGNQNDEKPHSPRTLKNRIDNRRILSNLFKAVDLEEEFLDKLVLKKIDLHEIVGNCLIQSNPMTTNLTWKLVICLPNTNYESSNRAICEMVKRKFSGFHVAENDCDDPDLILCQSKTYQGSKVSVQVSPTKKRLISLCVRCVNSQVLAEEVAMSEKKRREKLSGTSCILFLHIDPTDNELETEVCSEDEEDSPLERLGSLLRNLPRDPPIPLLVMTTSRDNLEGVAKSLHLDQWEQQHFITNYHVTRISLNVFNLESLVNIDKSVVWLAENSPASNYPVSLGNRERTEATNRKLSVKPLTHFVQEFVSNYIYTEFYNNLENRLLKGYTHQHPNTLISLFNSSIDHLIKVASNPVLQEVSWPIPELKSYTQVYGCGEVVPSYWNEAAYTDKVCETLKMLSLPQFNKTLKNAASKQDQHRAIEDYFSQLVRSYCDSTIAMSDIKHILNRTYEMNASHIRSSLRQGESYEHNAPSLPWTDLVVTMANYRISCMNTNDPFATSGSEMLVGYFYLEYHLPKVWLSNLNWKGCINNMTVCNSQETKTTTAQSHEHQYRSDLDIMLNNEKSRSEEFETTLLSAIDGRTETEISNRPVFEESEKEKNDSQLTSKGMFVENTKSLGSSRYYYVPLVSYLSPTLGLFAAHSPNTLKERVEVFNSSDHIMEESLTPTQQKHRNKVTPHVKENDLSQYLTNTLTYSHSKSRIVESLKESVEKDIEESEAFDKKLQEALMVD